MKKRYGEEQIVGILNDSGKGNVAEVCRKHGVSDQTYCDWKKKRGGMAKSDVAKLRMLNVFSHKADPASVQNPLRTRLRGIVPLLSCFSIRFRHHASLRLFCIFSLFIFFPPAGGSLGDDVLFVRLPFQQPMIV